MTNKGVEEMDTNKPQLTEAEQLARGDNLAILAKKYKTVAKLPDDYVIARSSDKTAAVLIDGTRVNDAMLAEANRGE